MPIERPQGPLRYLLCAALVMSWACTEKGAENAAERARGLYVFGHEVRTFQECDGAETLWVTTSEEVGLQLRQRHAELTERPYEAIEVVVLVRSGGSPRAGQESGAGGAQEAVVPALAADYDGLIWIEELISARRVEGDHCSDLGSG